MSGQISRYGFTGDKTEKVSENKSVRGHVLVITVIALMLAGSFVALAGMNQSSSVGGIVCRAGATFLGAGNTSPDIVAGADEYLIAWYGYDSGKGTWNLNVTVVDAENGDTLNSEHISSDIYIKYGKPRGLAPKAGYDPDNGDYLLVWYSQNRSLAGEFLNKAGVAVTSEFVINGTQKSDYHAVGVSYTGSGFVVSWSTTGYRSYFRVVSYVSGSVSMGAVSKLSEDTAHAHVNHASAASSESGTVAFVWRNSTGNSGYYNITMRIFEDDMNAVKYNDFTVANGYANNKTYDMPNIAAGNGEYLVVYALRTSPYSVYGTIVKNNTVYRSFLVGDSYYGVKSYGLGVAYNGSGGFVVSWPDSDKNIDAVLFDSEGNVIWHRTVVADGNKNEGARVAAVPGAGTANYTFVWYDNTNGVLRYSYVSGAVLVPELNPYLIVPVIGVIVMTFVRRHKN